MKTSSNPRIPLPSGALSLHELTAILKQLPIQLSFIDNDNVFRYFDGQELFERNTSMLGTDVYTCHSPQTHPLLTEILKEFRKGTQSTASFWHRRDTQLILMRYFAIRNEQGEYIGCLAVYQDISPLQTLKGEQHTLVWERPSD